MGKIRVATLGDQESEQGQKDKRNRQREEKKKREKVHVPGMKGGERTVAMTSDEEIDKLAKMSEEQEKMEAEFAGKKPADSEKKRKRARKQQRSRAYKQATMKVDSAKIYPIDEAVKLLREITLTKFTSTVELHINTLEKGLRGMVTLPHGTGKKLRVVIADDEVIAKVKSGQIDFDILVAHPTMMSKIAGVAKILGPKGLMPNPKAGTISDKPQETVKKLSGGQMQYKTETEQSIIHTVIGKMDFDDKKLVENYKSMIAAVTPTKITSVTLKSTMSPGIKVAFN